MHKRMSLHKGDLLSWKVNSFQLKQKFEPTFGYQIVVFLQKGAYVMLN